MKSHLRIYIVVVSRSRCIGEGDEISGRPDNWIMIQLQNAKSSEISNIVGQPAQSVTGHGKNLEHRTSELFFRTSEVVKVCRRGMTVADRSHEDDLKFQVYGEKL